RGGRAGGGRARGAPPAFFVREHAGARRLRAALRVAAEPLPLDVRGERHPSVDAAERLRVGAREPWHPRRPVTRMEAAAGARVRGALVETVAKRIDFTGG